MGRDRELAALLGLLSARPSVALVEGEAGAGKSRLVEELLAAAQHEGLAAIVGSAHPLPDPFPLGPVIEALSRCGPYLKGQQLDPLAGALRPLLPDLADQLPPAPDPVGDSGAERHRLFRAVAAVLEAVGPSVLVLEDLHWADARTLEFLTFLLRRLPTGVCVLLTYRGHDLPADSPVRGLVGRIPPSTARESIELLPLSVGDVQSLVEAMLDADAISDEFATYLHERTAGIPFAVEEVLRLLISRDDLTRQDGRWVRRALDELRVPAAVRHAVLERLGGLGHDAQAMVSAAAVVGQPVNQAVLTAVAGLDVEAAAHGLSEALAVGLLEEDTGGRCTCRHDLAREAVYDSLSGPDRRALHAAAARALSAEPRGTTAAARVARHWQLADQPQEFARVAEVAAREALQLHNDDAAADLLLEVLEVPDLDPVDRWRLTMMAGEAAIACGGPAARPTIGALTSVVEGGSITPTQRGEARFILGRLLLAAGEVEASRAAFIASVDELESVPGLAARAMASVAVTGALDGRASKLVDWLDRAVKAADAQVDSFPRLTVAVDRASVLMYLAHPKAWDAARALPDSASDPAERRQLLRAWTNLSFCAMTLGHHVYADELRDRAVELARSTGDAWLDESLESLGIVLDSLQGRWDGLVGRIDRFVASGPRPTTVLLPQHVRAELLLAQGRVDQARDEIHAVLATAETSGFAHVIAFAAGLAARTLLTDGNATGAVGVITKAWDVTREGGEWPHAARWVPVGVDALLRDGDTVQAQRLVDDLAAGLAGTDAPAATAALRSSEALVARARGEWRQAVRLHEQAERSWRELPSPSEAAQERERRAELLLVNGDERGAPLIADVLASYEALGASWDADRVRRTARRHRVNLKSRRGRKGYGDALSPRELEVVGLVATGATNAEIAEQLSLSPRTVAHHVASAMRKRGVSSRTALAVSVVSADDA